MYISFRQKLKKKICIDVDINLNEVFLFIINFQFKNYTQKQFKLMRFIMDLEVQKIRCIL